MIYTYFEVLYDTPLVCPIACLKDMFNSVRKIKFT